MSRLRVKKSIERIAVALTQFARDEQWLHLNRQRTQTVGECLIGAMGSGQLILSDAGTQQCSSRDVEHRIIGSVDRTVGIVVLQFARGGQCALGFKS